MPALSNSKLLAIRSMGMGTLNKLVLHFPAVFWDQVDFLGHAGKDRRKWLLFMDMSRVSKRPILVAMSGGPFAVLSERLSDTEITRRAMDVIRSIYPDAPDPVSSRATRWKTSKFSRGSFSFIPPGCRSARVVGKHARCFSRFWSRLSQSLILPTRWEPLLALECDVTDHEGDFCSNRVPFLSPLPHSAKEYDTLAEPVCDRRGKPRVLFAGEHTTKYHPSTVHGAWLTGLREATRLDSHARAGWHRKGKRDDDFSPDIMYETSVLFDATRVASRARKGSRRGPGKVRIRPSKQSDGTDCRRSPRIDPGEQSGKRRRSDGPTRTDKIRNEGHIHSAGRPVRAARRQEPENYFAKHSSAERSNK